mmetsp:Transcript_38473/g.75553  ORF Transcript_38473/g.75553 Transcript_38473/m.75553 type:complete len:118 (-) Transcript_38473:784-1137(-)
MSRLSHVPPSHLFKFVEEESNEENAYFPPDTQSSSLDTPRRELAGHAKKRALFEQSKGSSFFVSFCPCLFVETCRVKSKTQSNQEEGKRDGRQEIKRKSEESNRERWVREGGGQRKA